MKANRVAVTFVAILFLAACQSTTPTQIPLSTDVEPIETPLAATISAGLTSTAAAGQSSTQVAPTATAPAPTPTTVLFHVNVPADACWMNSQISVHAGQKVSIFASGRVNTYGGRQGSDSEPDGQKSICGAVQCPVQGAGYGALIGRLEDGKPFLVGRNFEFTATQDGQLYFTVNDWTCKDNSGIFNLTIKIE